MDDLKLKTVVQGEIDNALGYIESETTEERTEGDQLLQSQLSMAMRSRDGLRLSLVRLLRR
jgi:hypothetical protein